MTASGIPTRNLINILNVIAHNKTESKRVDINCGTQMVKCINVVRSKYIYAMFVNQLICKNF